MKEEGMKSCAWLSVLVLSSSQDNSGREDSCFAPVVLGFQF